MSQNFHDTKQKVLHAVIQLLAQGKSKLSMSQIAMETGVSKSTLYHFFENKKDLFQQVVFFIFEQMTAEIETIAEKDIEPKEKLQLMMNTCISFADRETSVTHFVFQQVFENDTHMLQEIHTMREHMKSFFVETLREGMEKGIFRQKDIAKTAEIVVGYIDFIALRSALPSCTPEKDISVFDLSSHLLTLLTP